MRPTARVTLVAALGLLLVLTGCTPDKDKPHPVASLSVPAPTMATGPAGRIDDSWPDCTTMQPWMR